MYYGIYCICMKSPATWPFFSIACSGSSTWITSKHFTYRPFVRGIHQWPVGFLHKEPVMQKEFLCHEAIMIGIYHSYFFLFCSLVIFGTNRPDLWTWSPWQPVILGHHWIWHGWIGIILQIKGHNIHPLLTPNVPKSIKLFVFAFFINSSVLKYHNLLKYKLKEKNNLLKHWVWDKMAAILQRTISI